MRDDSHFVFHQQPLYEDGSVRREVVMVNKPGLVSPKFGATTTHVIMQSPQNVAVQPRIYSVTCWDRCFALPQLLYRCRHQSGIFYIPPHSVDLRSEWSYTFTFPHPFITWCLTQCREAGVRGTRSQQEKFPFSACLPQLWGRSNFLMGNKVHMYKIDQTFMFAK
jgi:hypothetical protein